MIIKRKPAEPTKLKSELDRLLDHMSTMDPETKEYSATADQVAKLYKLQEQDAPKRVSPDTWAVVGANLAGILIIVGHERVHVITSKAVGFIMKMR